MVVFKTYDNRNILKSGSLRNFTENGKAKHH